MRFTTKNVLTQLTLENLLKHVNEYSIWSYYTGLDIKFGKKYLSPVRSESDPSAVFFYSTKGNILLKDFGGETWNLVKFLKFRNIRPLQIAQDFNLPGYQREKKVSLNPSNAVIKHFKIPEGTSASIKVKRKKWNHEELQFWADYHISKTTLDFYHISPLKCYWITKDSDYQEYCKAKDELIFVFSFGNAFYKIYRPMGDKKKNKWYSNTPKDVLMGFDQLPLVGDTLIITKGMKELCILKELGYPAVALQGETSYPNITNLKKRFKNIYSIMDNDVAGDTASVWFKENHDIPCINFSIEYKDLAEFTKDRGLKSTNKLINEQL